MTHEIIYTDRLMLRAFEREDTDALFEILSDEKSNRFLPWFTAKTTEDAQRFFETRCKAVYENSDGLCYAICQKDLGKPIGYVTVKGTAPFDLGYGLASRYWNNGYATEACKAVIRKCGSDGMDYLTATHDVLNPASGRVMQKCGMRYIHSYREHWMPKDIDVVFPSLPIRSQKRSSRMRILSQRRTFAFYRGVGRYPPSSGLTVFVLHRAQKNDMR